MNKNVEKWIWLLSSTLNLVEYSQMNSSQVLMWMKTLSKSINTKFIYSINSISQIILIKSNIFILLITIDRLGQWSNHFHLLEIQNLNQIQIFELLFHLKYFINNSFNKSNENLHSSKWKYNYFRNDQTKCNLIQFNPTQSTFQ